MSQEQIYPAGRRCRSTVPCGEELSCWGGNFTPLNVYPIKFKGYLIEALNYSTGAKTIPLGYDPFTSSYLII